MKINLVILYKKTLNIGISWNYILRNYVKVFKSSGQAVFLLTCQNSFCYGNQCSLTILLPCLTTSKIRLPHSLSHDASDQVYNVDSFGLRRGRMSDSIGNSLAPNSQTSTVPI